MSLVRAPWSTERYTQDQLPQENGLAHGAEKLSELNEEDFKRESQSEIPFEKNSFKETTSIAGENAVNEQVENKLTTGN